MEHQRQPQLQDTSIDIRLRLAALWIATMFVYAYVDIFSLLRADYLSALLDGTVINTPFVVGQGFLVATVIYILPGSLMIPLSLMLPARASRRANIVVASVYIVTIALSGIGEAWLYYLLGSAVEIVLLGVVIGLARRWPADVGLAAPAAHVVPARVSR